MIHMANLQADTDSPTLKTNLQSPKEEKEAGRGRGRNRDM